MNRTPLADLAMRLLRKHGASGRTQLGDRAGTVAALERALAARARRRRPLALSLIGVAAAAAIAIIGLRGGALTSHAVTARLNATAPGAITRIGAGGHNPDGLDIMVGDRLHPASAIEVTLSTGTTIAVAPASDLQMVELGLHQRLSLEAGVLRAHVQKLRRGEEFSVTTPDARISVRGTAFEVAVARDEACGGRSSTRVQVFEGVVTVDHNDVETRLTPAQIWTTPCRAKTPSATRSTPPAAAVIPPAAPASTRPVAQVVPRSTLAEQNELLARALTARRQGDLVLAARYLDDLLTRFPRGPLAEPAARARRELASQAP